MKTVFLSDIHIGTDAPTNLYQTSTDQANLKRILKYVQDNGSQVKDLVILGDWLDLWMYGARVVPPTVQQIIAANPQIFTRQSDGSGDFVSCLESIQGTIHYVNGNHDITVTADDIQGYFDTVSKKQVHCIDCSKEAKGYVSDSGDIFGEHGHWYSMVCRPYENEPLPLGYFITRAGMEVMIVKRRPLPPLNVVGIQELISYNGLTFAQAMLTEMANQIGIKCLKDLIFTMPDGSKIGADAVAAKFPNLSINEMDFLRADDGGSLDVSAYERLHTPIQNRLIDKLFPLCTTPKIVLFGHTHIKEMQQYNKKIYANTGFLCANKSTNGIPVSTFVEIEDCNGHKPYTVSMIKLDYQTGAFSVDKTLSIK